MGWFWGVLGGSKLEKHFCKNGVGVGRTKLSLRAIGTTVCALSSGHGPRGLGFQGGSSGLDFCICLGGRYCVSQKL